MEILAAFLSWVLCPEHFRALTLFALPGLVATSTAIAIGLSVASAGAGYMANKAQQQGGAASAEAYARMMDIPYYGPGEKVTRKATQYIANKVLGGGLTKPISSMAQIRSGNLGDAVAGFSGGRGAAFMAPRERAVVSGGDILAKKQTRALLSAGERLAAGGLLGEQEGKANFADWKNKGYTDALSFGGSNQGNPALGLVPDVAGLAMMGYDAWRNGQPQGGTIYETPIGPTNDGTGGLGWK